MKVKVNKTGNSLTIVLPVAVAEYMRVSKGDYVDIDMKNNHKIEASKA